MLLITNFESVDHIRKNVNYYSWVIAPKMIPETGRCPGTRSQTPAPGITQKRGRAIPSNGIRSGRLSPRNGPGMVLEEIYGHSTLTCTIIYFSDSPDALHDRRL